MPEFKYNFTTTVELWGRPVQALARLEGPCKHEGISGVWVDDFALVGEFPDLTDLEADQVCFQIENAARSMEMQ